MVAFAKLDNQRVDAIIEGDALDILSTLEPQSVDLVITDPPYFLPVHSYVGIRGSGYERRSLADASILKGFFSSVWKELARVIKPTGAYYVFCDGQSYPSFYGAMFPYCKYVRPLIWDKVVSYNGYTWRHQHELIAWGELDASPRVPTGDGDILRCRGVLQKDRLHPAEKPVELLEKLIAKHEEAKVILDPFAGSASTCIAAKRMGRAYIGIELNPEYVAMGERRISEAMGLWESELKLAQAQQAMQAAGLPPGVPGAPVLPGQVYPPPTPAPGQPAGAQPGQAPPQGGKQ